MVEKIMVNLGERSYQIFISHNWLSSLGETMKSVGLSGKILIVTNPKIKNLYGERVFESIKNSGFEADIFEIPDGEIFKNLDTVSKIYDYLIEKEYSRQGILVALGGGVVGDITGFAAATYMRGIRFVQVPTSLIAMVDSSVGGKTGVNHPKEKNLIGSFHQPSLVFIDTILLDTLPFDEFRGGLAEVVKHGIIKEKPFFDFLQDKMSRILDIRKDEILRIVKTSCKIKRDVVEEDEKEKGIRAILNYGHTIGHAIESLTNFSEFKHGEAVAIGMMSASFIAKEMEILSEIALQKIWALIKKIGLPYKISNNISPEDIILQLNKDKKVKDGKVRFVLPTAIGKVTIRDDVPKEIIIKSLERIQQ